jgi:hypothetical protein
MAGDYEYFAAQGHHPLAFALAELVDNSLRATKGNSCVGCARRAERQAAHAGAWLPHCGTRGRRLLASFFLRYHCPHWLLTLPRLPMPRERPRSIVVSLVIDDSASRGLVAVRDNGVGMAPQVRRVAGGGSLQGGGRCACKCLDSSVVSQEASGGVLWPPGHLLLRPQQRPPHFRRSSTTGPS